jgi:predicted amidohydrolase YtcJ
MNESLPLAALALFVLRLSTSTALAAAPDLILVGGKVFTPDPAHPVYPNSWFGHADIISSVAMKRLGVRDDEPDPLGGRFERELGTRCGPRKR